MKEDLKDLILNLTRLLILWKNGIYDFNYDRALEFSFDIAEYFEKEPAFFDDEEIKKLMEELTVAMTPFIKSLFDDFYALEMTFIPAREAFPDKKYYWLYLPETLMNKETLKEWNKYLKKRGFKNAILACF